MKNNKDKKILVIGVGGGGQSILNRFQKIAGRNFKLITINSDEQILKLSDTYSILFSEEQKFFKKFSKSHFIKNLEYFWNYIFNRKQSCGCGGNPALGEELAQNHISLLKDDLKHFERVFVISALGGGLGSGATPVIVDYIKQFNIKLTVIVTKPFRFEGRKRLTAAYTAIEKIKELTKDCIIYDNEQIIEKFDKKMTFNEALSLADNEIIAAIRLFE